MNRFLICLFKTSCEPTNIPFFPFCFFTDGVLSKHNRGRNTERHVFLFDALIVLCKPNLRRASVSGIQGGEFKLKEKFNIRKITVRDREDCEGKCA